MTAEARYQMLRPLSDLRVGDHVIGTVISREPWGLIVRLDGVEAVGASVDWFRHRGKPGVQAPTRSLPAVGTTVELVINELRPWHKEPWVWVRLAPPEPETETDRQP
jgi:hypothetical protein